MRGNSRNNRAISVESRDKAESANAAISRRAPGPFLGMGALVFMLITVNVN